MIKNGAYYYTHQTILSPKDAYGELQEYLGVYISDYLTKKYNYNKEDAENLAIELTEKFIETGNFEDATDEYIENFVDKDLK